MTTLSTTVRPNDRPTTGRTVADRKPVRHPPGGNHEPAVNRVQVNMDGRLQHARRLRLQCLEPGMKRHGFPVIDGKFNALFSP